MSNKGSHRLPLKCTCVTALKWLPRTYMHNIYTYIHKIHHTQDNINYTFLNGCTDFIVNYFAIKYFNGYKNNIDLHYLKYKGQTSNR